MPRKRDPELHLVAIRLRSRDIATAKRYAASLGRGYQEVVRQWVRSRAEGVEAVVFGGR